MEGGRNDIFVTGFDGRPPTQLTRDAGNNESPSWSPDGSMIVFSSTREGRSRIYVMTAFGTDQRQLLTLPGEQTNPQWSPNTGF
jgi:TolB protein